MFHLAQQSQMATPFWQKTSKTIAFFVVLLVPLALIGCGAEQPHELDTSKSNLSTSPPTLQYSYEYRNLPLAKFAIGAYRPDLTTLQTPTDDGFNGWVYLFKSRPSPVIFQQNPNLFPQPAILTPTGPQPNPAFGMPNPAALSVGVYFNSGVRVTAGQYATTATLNPAWFNNAPPAELPVFNTNGDEVDRAFEVAKIIKAERADPQFAPLLRTTIARLSLFRWKRGQVVHYIVNKHSQRKFVLFTTAANPLTYQPQVDTSQVGAIAPSLTTTPGFTNNWTYQSCVLRRPLTMIAAFVGVKVASLPNALAPAFQRLAAWRRIKCSNQPGEFFSTP